MTTAVARAPERDVILNLAWHFNTAGAIAVQEETTVMLFRTSKYVYLYLSKLLSSAEVTEEESIVGLGVYHFCLSFMI